MAHVLAGGHGPLAMIEFTDQPAVLVLADGDARAVRDAATRAGCRVMATAPLADGLARIDEAITPAAVWLEVEQEEGGEFDRLLDRLESAARSGRHGSVVCAPARLIDRVAARAGHARIEHLCAPSDEDRIAALLAVTAPADARLHDYRRDDQRRLQQLSEEVGRIASVLAELSDDEAAAGAEAEAAPPLDAAPIRATIRARRLRERFFPEGLFADPAWDMLLDLMAARLERRRVAVSSLCIAAAVPPTTALRWIKSLTDAGLFVRTADPEDGRRIYVELSEQAAATVESYFRAVRRIAPIPV